MAKKVIGIILIILSVFSILGGAFMLLLFGLLGGTFGLIGDMSGLQVEEGATIESVVGEVYDVTDSQTAIYYEVDGVPYLGYLSMVTSMHTPGTVVTVEYDSSNPANFAVPEMNDVFGSFGSIFGGVGVAVGLIAIIPGIAMLIIGIVLIKKSKKEAIATTMA